MSLTTIWVDLDDTLIDFHTNAAAALTAMWREEPLLERLFASPELWADRYEHFNLALWDRYNRGEIERDYLRMERFRRPLAEAGLPDAEARATSVRYDPLYLGLLAQGRALMPGAMELMKWLRTRAVTIGCLSNGFKDVQFRKIRTAGLEPYFDLVVLSDDIGVNKPDRRLFDYAMQRAGDTDPSRHLMIGDNPSTDIAGALGAGWYALYYKPGATPSADALPAPGAGAVTIGRLVEAEPLLEPLTAGASQA